MNCLKLRKVSGASEEWKKSPRTIYFNIPFCAHQFYYLKPFRIPRSSAEILNRQQPGKKKERKIQLWNIHRHIRTLEIILSTLCTYICFFWRSFGLIHFNNNIPFRQHFHLFHFVTLARAAKLNKFWKSLHHITFNWLHKVRIYSTDFVRFFSSPFFLIKKGKKHDSKTISHSNFLGPKIIANIKYFMHIVICVFSVFFSPLKLFSLSFSA